MAPVTSVVLLPLKPGTDVFAGEGKQSLHDALKIMSEQPGVNSIWWGPHVETSSELQLFIEYASYEDHVKFGKSDAIKEFQKHISAIALGPPSNFHVEFPAGINDRVCKSPVVEIATMYVPKDKAAAYKPNFDKFVEALSKADGPLVVASGPSVEDAEHPSFKDKGGKGARYLLLIGWESVGTHMAFRDTPAFRENVHLLREGASGIEMHHVKFRKFDSSA